MKPLSDREKSPGLSRLVARKLFDVREGEFQRCAWMFCYLLLLISAMMMVKPVSMALFLTEFSAQHLPFVYILTAVLAAAVSAWYARLLKTRALEKLMRSTLGSAVFLLPVFWCFIQFQWARGAFLYLFLVWTGLITLICASQFWLAAGLFFNVREAKRLFGPIGSGAIIGGITGGYVTKFLAPVIGSQNLVFPAACCLGACMLIMEKMWRIYGGSPNHPAPEVSGTPVPAGQGSVLFQIIRSPQLRLMAAILAVSVVAARLVDYQFNAIVSESITDKDQLASFLGFWMSNLNFLSLAVQVLLTRKIIQHLGVGTALFFLPSGVLLGAAATLIHPAVWTAVVIRLGEGCFKNSLNKSGMELLFLPVPRSLKIQAKAFIDVFVDAAAGGLGGILLLIMILGFEIPPSGVSLVLFLLICGWFYLVLHVRRAYLRAFSDKLKSGDAEAAGEELMGPVPSDLRVRDIITEALNGADEKQTLKMLRMMAGYYHDTFDPCLVGLLDHTNPEIRTAALAQLYFSRKTDVSAKAILMARSGDIPCMTEAIRYLYHRAQNPVHCLSTFLADSDYRVQGAALLCLARESRKNRRLKESMNPEHLVEESLLAADGLADKIQSVFIKKTCAEAVSAGDLYPLYPYLYILMEESDPQVAAAAVKAAGETRDPRFIRTLLSFLGRRTIFKHAAASALKCHGEQILDQLAEDLSNPYLNYSIRRHIPEVIAAVGGQKSVNILSRQLLQPDLGIRYEIIRALNRLRISSRTLFFDKSYIIPKIKKEASDYLDLLTILYAQKGVDAGHGTVSSRSRALEQLTRGLEIRLDACLERVFRLLGLSYPPVEMYNAYKGIRSTDAERRLNAVEFLDNLLEVDVKRIILPIIEAGGAPGSDSQADKTVSREDVRDSYIALLRGQDDFLKQKTLNLLACQPDNLYIPYMADLLSSPSAGVRKMARAALKKTGRFSLKTAGLKKGH